MPEPGLPLTCVSRAVPTSTARRRTICRRITRPTCNGTGRFIRWAEQIGQHTAAVVRLFLSAHKVEQQGYKSCMALLKLADRYSAQRLESACRKALSYTVSPSLKSVQSILKSGQDKLLAEDAPAKPEEPKAHKFTRGAGYYKRGE